MGESLYTIELLGASIIIRTEEDLHYIKQLETRYKKAIEEVKTELGLGDALSVAIMAGLFLANENFKLKGQAPQNGKTMPEDPEKAAAVLLDTASLLDKILKNN